MLVVGAWLAAFAAVQLALGSLFPAGGRYDFRVQELVWALVACGLTAFVASRSPRGRLLAILFVLLGAACVAAFLVDSPVGSNITRFRTVVLPFGLLALGLVGWRPRWLALRVCDARGRLHVQPLRRGRDRLDGHPGLARRLLAAGARVPANGARARTTASTSCRPSTTGRRTTCRKPASRMARGWYRQLDLARNPVLYDAGLTGAQYRGWLRENGVRFVLLPRAQLDRVAAKAQAALLRSGRSGLVEVASGSDWTIYELPRATPILTGPSRAGLTALDHERIAGWTGAPGEFLLRARYTPYWSVAAGDVCVERTAGGMTRVVARRAGPFELRIANGAGLLRDPRSAARPAGC